MDGELATNLLLGLIAVANLILLYLNSRGDREEKLSSTPSQPRSISKRTS